MNLPQVGKIVLGHCTAHPLPNLKKNVAHVDELTQHAHFINTKFLVHEKTFTIEIFT